MAASKLAEPGTEYGPCKQPYSSPCGHSDCATVRKMAEAICRICNVPIGYGLRFYGERTHPEGGTMYVHAVCLEREVEEEERGGPDGSGGRHPSPSDDPQSDERREPGLGRVAPADAHPPVTPDAPASAETARDPSEDSDRNDTEELAS